jgi:hypothetical protein
MKRYDPHNIRKDYEEDLELPFAITVFAFILLGAALIACFPFESCSNASDSEETVTPKPVPQPAPITQPEIDCSARVIYYGGHLIPIYPCRDQTTN